MKTHILPICDSDSKWRFAPSPALFGGGCDSRTHKLWTELQTRVVLLFATTLRQCNSGAKAFIRLREQPKRLQEKLGTNRFAAALQNPTKCFCSLAIF